MQGELLCSVVTAEQLPGQPKIRVLQFMYELQHCYSSHISCKFHFPIKGACIDSCSIESHPPTVLMP